MGKRSGVPHRDEELDRLTVAEIEAQLREARMRLEIAASTKSAKQWQKRIHWLESGLAKKTAG